MAENMSSKATKSPAVNQTTLDRSELQSFVADAVTAVMEGIASAQTKLAPMLPGASTVMAQMFHPFARTYEYRPPENIDFDIAVTVERSFAAKGGAKIAILGSEVGAGGDTSREHSVATRISFSVPIRPKFQRAQSRPPGSNAEPFVLKGGSGEGE